MYFDVYFMLRYHFKFVHGLLNNKRSHTFFISIDVLKYELPDCVFCNGDICDICCFTLSKSLCW